VAGGHWPSKWPPRALTELCDAVSSGLVWPRFPAAHVSGIVSARPFLRGQRWPLRTRIVIAGRAFLRMRMAASLPEHESPFHQHVIFLMVLLRGGPRCFGHCVSGQNRAGGFLPRAIGNMSEATRRALLSQASIRGKLNPAAAVGKRGGGVLAAVWRRFGSAAASPGAARRCRRRRRRRRFHRPLHLYKSRCGVTRPNFRADQSFERNMKNLALFSLLSLLAWTATAAPTPTDHPDSDHDAEILRLRMMRER
jgi:hypothetical protein